MSFTLQLGESAPDFALPGVDDKIYTLDDFKESRFLVVVFSSNHCPYVVGSEDRMKRFYADYSPRGAAMIAINSNETVGHPTDSFDHMKERAKDKHFEFPYVRDETQEVALAYGALYGKDGRQSAQPREGNDPRAARCTRRSAGRPAGEDAADQPDWL
jgi:peroxiredoxin